MVIVETSVFTRQVLELLTAEEYRRVQAALVNRPNLGSVIEGSGGLRKLRWGVHGRGKRGGVRIIYYWAAAQERLLVLFVYAKTVRDDLTPTQLKILRKIVEEEYP
jgi:mRNA-degrading endonuclease RelE of RelBE toxin-antitoxin system